MFDSILDMVYELNGTKNICIFENVIILEILGSNNLFKVISLEIKDG